MSASPSKSEREQSRKSSHSSRGNDRRKKRFAFDQQEEEDDSKYEYGKKEDKIEEKEDEKKKTKKVKPNFSLSGKLSEEARTTEKGIVLKFSEPADASVPKDKWRLYPFKGDTPLDPIVLRRKSSFLLGRDREVVDIPLDHPSCSKQHAVIQFRSKERTDDDLQTRREIKPYIMDLESTNGTLLNKEKIPTSRYVELKEKDILSFGFSTRDYVVLRENE